MFNSNFVFWGFKIIFMFSYL